MSDNITDLKVGLGADMKQLDADLEIAKKKIAEVGNAPIKITVTPDIDAKSSISKIQREVAKRPIKVSTELVDSKSKSNNNAMKQAQPTITPKVDITDASGKLGFFEERVKEIKKVSGNVDVAVKIDTNAFGEVTKGVISYTNAVGQAKSETYKLVNVLDETGTEASKEFQYIGDALSESSTKVAKFSEGLKGVKNTLDSFAMKNADIADEIGLDKLKSDFAMLEKSTNAEVVAIQKFKNELGAAKVKAEELRFIEKVMKQNDIANETDERNIEKTSSLQRQLELQDAIKAIRQGDTAEMQRQLTLLTQMEQSAKNQIKEASEVVPDTAAQLEAQKQINNIYKQREQIVAANASYERQALSETQALTREQTAAERQRRAEQQAMAQEQMAHEQTLQQIRSVSMSTYRQQQEEISRILKKQLEYVNRRLAAEGRSTGVNKQAIAALQLEKATLRTTAHTARMTIYARDFAAYMAKAKNNMSGMQGYARSTANIFKGIILSQAFYRGLGAVKGVVSDAWELSVALNTAEATFSGMLEGGQKQAQGLLEVLKQEAINTPFDVENLTQATRLLTAYGIKAENLMFVMRGVEKATAASGDASKMESISRALGQIYTKGKLMGEEVRQLTEAGIAVSDILTEELGLTQAQLAKGWAKLNLDANTAINAIVRGIDKRYGKALDNMAKTTEQKINNMRESFALIASSLTDPIRRSIDSLIDVITPKLERMYQAIQAVGLGNAMRTLLPTSVFDGAVRAIDGIVRAVQALKIVFQQAQPIIQAVMGALSWYGSVVYNIFISVVSVIGMFGQALGQSANGVTALETGLKRVLMALLAYKTAMLMIGAVSKIWGLVSIVIKGVMLTIQGAIVYTQMLAATMAAAGAAGAAGFVPIIGVLLVIIGLVAALAGSLGSVISAAKGVGVALKKLGGGTNLGSMFKDMGAGLQDSIDAYNKEVTKQNEAYNNELAEEEGKQTDASEGAASATKKAMQGLMSFDEVYKLNEPGGGGGSGDVEPVEVVEMPPIDFGGVFDDFGGLGDDFFSGLDLSELQNALGDLWSEIYPLLDEILIYVAKMLLYFKSMHLYSKMMSEESKEQELLEKSQTSEDKEQELHEKGQTSEDTEQELHEKAQTSEDKEQELQEKAQTSQDKEQLLSEQAQTSQDKEQLLSEQAQTSQDKEQLLHEQAQTSQDKEQLLSEQAQTNQDKEQLLSEQAQTSQDKEQLLNEQAQSSQDKEQLLHEQAQTSQDKEQLLHEQAQTSQDKEQLFHSRGGGIGAGNKGTAAALGLINIAQLAMDAKLLSDDIKDLMTDGATVGEWMSLFVDGLMAAVDALGLFMAIKMFTGAGAKVAGGAATAAAGGAATAAAGGAATAGIGATLAGLLPVIGTIVAVVTAIGLVIAGIHLVVKNWDSISKFFTSAWQSINAKLGEVANNIGTWFGAIGTKLGETVNNIGTWFGAIGTKLGEVAGKVGEWFSKAFDTIAKGLISVWESVLKPVWSAIAMGLKLVWETVRLAFWSIALGLKTSWEMIKQVIDTIGKALMAAWTWFKTTIIEPIGKALMAAWTWFKTAIIEPIGKALMATWNWFKSSIIEPIGRALMAAWNAVDRVWTNIRTGLQAAWNAVDRVWSSVRSGLELAWSAVDRVWASVATGLQSAWNAVDMAWDNVITGLNAVKSTLSGIGTSIGNAVSNATKKISNAADAAKKAVTGSSSTTTTSKSTTTAKKNADGGIVRKHAKGAIFSRPTQIGNDLVGEAGTEILFPLENTSFIKAFAEDIAKAVGNVNMQQSASNINVQMEQARAGAVQTMSISTASAKEISDAIRSWFTPQMQSLHDVLEEDRVVEVTVPPTSNALWRTILGELKAVNASSGARGFQLAN